MTCSGPFSRSTPPPLTRPQPTLVDAPQAKAEKRLALNGDISLPDTADSADFPLDVPAAFVAGALLAVATDWLQRGCPRTPLEMTILTKPLLIALRPGTGTPPTTELCRAAARAMRWHASSGG